MPADAHPRQARAVALASASFGLGLAGHLHAGGHHGSAGSLMFGAVFCVLSGWVYSWRPLPAPAVTGVLLGNQLILHVAMALGAPANAAAAAGCAEGHAVLPGAGPALPAAADPAMSLLPGRWMLLAHLVASWLSAAVIVAVEAVWLGVTTLSAWFARVSRLAVRTPQPLCRPEAAVTARARTWTSRTIGARPGRGPPHLHLTW